MKTSFLILLAFVSAFMCSASSNKVEDCIPTENNTYMTNDKIKIKVNSQIFTATLLDNNSAKAFKEMLPLTVDMIELNGKEKYCDLPNSFPTNSSNPQTIKNGDLMLFGSKTLVLFYKTFSTSYSYTKLGKIDDVTGLASTLGSENTTITFEIE